MHKCVNSPLYIYRLSMENKVLLRCDFIVCISFIKLTPFLFSPLTFCYKFELNFSFDFFSSFFIADHGKIIKAVNAESADSSKKVNSVVIEELDVLPTNEPIRNLEIIRTTQYGE